ncbi:hypothetical protein [Dolichospermum flos-aquae]|jgi:acyl carrier protein|uniref:Uncharacterized protein n=1 Tax=Dolichospermum flos-aquae LEGE 04289 TaxID=1828708 RepID=A0ACC5PZ30_DOLFA|nr:hypothetical protein [Dolichospermum flos-aquae]MBE9217612.1 hypothetical protein [Dolichospermum flos-aquae LEGE 04289]
MEITGKIKTSIETQVLLILEKILLKPSSNFKLTDRIIQDLKVASDDVSFILIPELENVFNLNIPYEEWEKVFTIQDTINLLTKYVTKSDFS